MYDYDYTGAVQKLTLPKGKFKFECWGAMGGYRSSVAYAGRGGYSVGTLTLTANTNIFIYVGGQGGNQSSSSGTSTLVAGGFNGGGSRYGYKGGGGASDIRIGTDSLYARVIVAGGGGSDGATAKTGMYGGGESGGSSTQSYGSGGGGGTQTAGGTGGSGNAGTFGTGGTGLYRSSGYAGAGGGGWYGGGGSYPDGSGDDDRGGGGGSGYVYTSATASNYPSGCLLNSNYYLTDATTTAGNVSFLSPTGTSETGHSGNGYVRITVIEAGIDPPTNLKCTKVDYYGATLTWTAASGATGYSIYKDGTKITSTTSTSVSISGLTPDSSIEISVKSKDSSGTESADAASITIETSKCTVLQTAQELQSVTIAWDSTSFASTYYVYKDGTLVYSGSSATCTLEGLYPSEEYTLTIKIGSTTVGTIVAYTEEGYYEQKPVFNTIKISPNPTTTNTTITISVTVEDKIIVVGAEKFYSNEIYAGEV